METFDEKIHKLVAESMFPAVMNGDANVFVDISVALSVQLGKVLATLSSCHSDPDKHLDQSLIMVLIMVMEGLSRSSKEALVMIKNIDTDDDKSVRINSGAGIDMLNKLIQKGKEGKGG